MAPRILGQHLPGLSFARLAELTLTVTVTRFDVESWCLRAAATTWKDLDTHRRQLWLRPKCMWNINQPAREDPYIRRVLAIVSLLHIQSRNDPPNQLTTVTHSSLTRILKKLRCFRNEVVGTFQQSNIDIVNLPLTYPDTIPCNPKPTMPTSQTRTKQSSFQGRTISL